MEETNGQESKESAPEGAGEGNQPKENTLIDDTNLASKRMEEATKASQEERLAREQSYNKMKLGGGTDAGQEEEKTPEVKKVEGAAEFFKGTALENDIKKANE